MTAPVIDGKALAEEVRARIATDVAQLTEVHGIVPGLAAVLVGDDPASEVYVGMKHRATEKAGMLSRQIRLPADTTQEDLERVISELNEDEAIDGILVQLPLPDHLDPRPIQELIVPDKDVDALNPYTAGRLAVGDPTFLSCTPYGVLEILEQHGHVPLPPYISRPDDAGEHTGALPGQVLRRGPNGVG
jgi:methylenetetrahydrofolate dehydrogenase (NADP+) / methenyltetrahydrofolate cyclohydrolase